MKECPIPTVVKADGLALGKGVVIASTREEAEEAIKSMMVDKAFGHSGEKIVVEEFLSGPEVSVLAFTDARPWSPMASSMDHKRALDNDEGLNTGGMGTVAPNPYYTEAVASECMERIFLPTIRAMKAEGRPFQGCLYFGLMITKDGPKVIEYNCRFGDPETQVVLPLLKSDLFTVMRAVTEGRLKDVPVEFDSGAACCVILASKGYPQAYEKGCPITLPADYEGGEIYVAGARGTGRQALQRRRPRVGRDPNGPHAEGGGGKGLRFGRQSGVCQRLLPHRHWTPGFGGDGGLMVYRVFVEKKPGLDNEAAALRNDAVSFLGHSEPGKSAAFEPLRRGEHRPRAV